MRLIDQQLDIRDDLLLITSPVSKFFRIYSDFLYSNTGEFQAAASGTGTSTTYLIIDSNSTNHPGIASVNTGTTTAGHTRIGFGTVANANASILLGFGNIKFETCVLLPILSDATNTYSIQNGFSDATSLIDGVFFKYTHAENSGRWQACTRSNNGTINTINTGVTVTANTWYKQTILINSNATVARFYIDNVLVATTSTSIPSGTNRQTIASSWIIKSLGTTNRSMNIDYIEIIGNIPGR